HAVPATAFGWRTTRRDPDRSLGPSLQILQGFVDPGEYQSHTGRPMLGIALNHAAEQRPQPRQHRDGELGLERVGLEEDAREDFLRLETGVELATLEELVEHEAEGEDVGAEVDGDAHATALQPELLRCAVLVRPEHRAGGGPLARISQLHQAEVRQQRMDRRLGAQEDVARLDVAMNHAGVLHAGRVHVGLGVRIRERVGDLAGDLEGVEHGRPAVRLQMLGQVRAVHVLHLQVVLVIVATEIEDLHDVLVPQPGEGATLAAEARHGLVTALVGLHLERPDLVESEVPDLVDEALASLAEPPEHLVLAGDDHGVLHRTTMAVELSRPPRSFASSIRRSQARSRSPPASSTTRPISSAGTRSWTPSDVSTNTSPASGLS